MPAVRPTAVIPFAASSCVIFLLLAFWESAAATSVKLDHRVVNALPYQAPATIIPTTVAATMASQSSSIAQLLRR